jgi:hypothetical protein
MNTPCPMPPSWRRWSNMEHVRTLSDDEREAAAALRRVPLVERIAVVPVVWVVADDDVRVAGPSSGSSFGEGSPHHAHADLAWRGRRLHLDRVGATARAPGRSYAECRIFDAGRLVGRGGSFGCSLGGGNHGDLPARARLDAQAMLLLGMRGPVEVWRCAR